MPHSKDMSFIYCENAGLPKTTFTQELISWNFLRTEKFQALQWDSCHKNIKCINLFSWFILLILELKRWTLKRGKTHLWYRPKNQMSQELFTIFGNAGDLSHTNCMENNLRPFLELSSKTYIRFLIQTS